MLKSSNRTVNIYGTQDSTSTRCALGTSSRELRMPTASGDVIRYVSLLLAGFEPCILDVRGGDRPDFSSGQFVGFEVDRAVMSVY